MGLIGRLASEGIRLRRSGPFLLAIVPEAAAGRAWWPAMDLLLRRHAASLAVTADLAQRFAEGATPEEIATLLAELYAEVPGILRDTVGCHDLVQELLAQPLAGADLDLACVASCRGLAIRALVRGDRPRPTVSRKGDEQDRGRRHRTAPPARLEIRRPATPETWRSSAPYPRPGTGGE